MTCTISRYWVIGSRCDGDSLFMIGEAKDARNETAAAEVDAEDGGFLHTDTRF